MNVRAIVAVTGTVVMSGLPACQACIVAPQQDTLRIDGALERASPLGDDAKRQIAYASKNARGEWWPCDLRLTATACVGAAHVNVYVTLPGVDTFEELGSNACVDADGNAFGAYELLRSRTDDDNTAHIPNDAQVLVLVASDADADGRADLDVDEETTAASILGEGEVLINSIGSFDGPVALTITGKTRAGRAVSIAVSGPTSAVTDIPTLDVASSCVAADAIK